MTVIREVKALEILDSRGNPTVQAIIRTSKGAAKASVPSGASTGIHEAHELRDGGKRYNGKGVLKAVANVNTKIAKALRGKSPANQKLIDTTLQSLDPSANKAKIGANAALAVSMAACRLGAGNRELFQHISNLAGNKKIRLPVPQMNILDGGAHVGAEHDIQEYMIVPLKFKSFSEALRAGTEAYHIVKERI
ncbi:MAG TPA: phosphopyruvate hydratase, partial [Candidatus Nanoarchaeia archaeon]|nr:phosphopyruvate hydratase [Candidatus Nanoarchaeia archaeon]